MSVNEIGEINLTLYPEKDTPFKGFIPSAVVPQGFKLLADKYKYYRVNCELVNADNTSEQLQPKTKTFLTRVDFSHTSDGKPLVGKFEIVNEQSPENIFSFQVVTEWCCFNITRTEVHTKTEIAQALTTNLSQYLQNQK